MFLFAAWRAGIPCKDNPICPATADLFAAMGWIHNPFLVKACVACCVIGDKAGWRPPNACSLGRQLPLVFRNRSGQQVDVDVSRLCTTIFELELRALHELESQVCLCRATGLRADASKKRKCTQPQRSAASAANAAAFEAGVAALHRGARLGLGAARLVARDLEVRQNTNASCADVITKTAFGDGASVEVASLRVARSLLYLHCWLCGFSSWQAAVKRL